MDEVRQIIAAAAMKRYQFDDVTIGVEPADGQFGDFATNLAFQLAGELKRSPKEIAAELAADIQGEGIEKAEAAGAGFINITMTDQYWLGRLKQVNQKFGSNNLGEGRKLQVEFISANPTGPLTIGNARGGFIGDSLARVMSLCGYKVTREYYFNDAGTQIDKLVESVRAKAGLIHPKEVEYSGEYIEELARDFRADLEKPDDEVKSILTQAIINRHIKPAIAEMGIEFDEWFNEADLIKDGSLSKVIDELKSKGLVFEKDGATWLDTRKLGVEREERVLIKSNGDPTYLAPDLAYHANIFGARHFDEAIKVLGPDHLDQFPSVQAAVNALYPHKDLKLASYQWFRLIKDGQEVKISKRLGQFVTISELIAQVGLPVARFMTLMRDEATPMDFDLDLAKQQSKQNPYWYVMYGYVRLKSILEKASANGLMPTQIDQLNDLERGLVKQISLLPGLIEQIQADYGVHRLTFYAMELAKQTHDYYESEVIIKLPKDQAESKLYFIQQLKSVYEVLFQSLGIEALPKMVRDLEET